MDEWHSDVYDYLTLACSPCLGTAMRIGEPDRLMVQLWHCYRFPGTTTRYVCTWMMMAGRFLALHLVDKCQPWLCSCPAPDHVQSSCTRRINNCDPSLGRLLAIRLCVITEEGYPWPSNEKDIGRVGLHSIVEPVDGRVSVWLFFISASSGGCV